MIEDYGDMQITLTVSVKHESTSAPWWMIIDPAQNMRTGKEACYKIASMITGPFFSRKEAQDWLDKTRYNFGPNAVVYCHSGHQSKQYEKAYYDARELSPANIPPTTTGKKEANHGK